MLRTLGIVQAGFSSPRFRANVSRRLGGHGLLEWVVRRATDSMRLDGVIVVACDAVPAAEISALVPTDVPVFQCEAPDMLSRIAAALERFPAEAAVRILGDNVFADPLSIDRLITFAESQAKCDYASYGSRDGQSAALFSGDIYAEWFRVSALRRADLVARQRADREQVTPYLVSHPDKFHVAMLPIPSEIDREDVRLTIANDDDWDHVQEIFDALGPEAMDWQRIATLLDHQPAMRRRMAALNRACASV